MVRMIIAAIVASSTLALSACNTMAGLGRDVERGGQKIENAAERNK